MRKSLILGLAAAVFMTCAGAARADKSALAFIDPAYTSGGPSSGFTNANSVCPPPNGPCVKNVPSVGSAKMSGCKEKIQFKGLSGFVDQERLICLAGADACIAAPGIPCGGGFGNTIVLRVVYSSLSLKASTKADVKDIGCGGLNATATNATVHCYKDGPYDPATLCAGSGGLWQANPTFVEASAATDGLVGLCQYFTPGTRLAAPGTALVARDGVTTQQAFVPTTTSTTLP